MIADKDRSGWIGASDTDKVLADFGGKSFADWWIIKSGYARNNYESEAMNAGTNWEGRILDALGIPIIKDRQVLLPDLRLRINLDGNTDGDIYEVKTHKADKPFEVPIKYKRQLWVQMYGTKIPHGHIVAYGLTAHDYINYFADIDPERLKVYDIPYDADFINKRYLPREAYLADCLTRGVFPTEEGFKKWL